ncbi:MAG TPA: phosphatidylserine decarboxylase family protein [Cytophagales bacterium]|nr:phosphatidylserine decarboxylase family protein [Cytophagales bacterium]
MTIHKEGYKTLTFTALGCLVFSSIFWFFIGKNDLLTQIAFGFSGFIFLVILQFFRHPTRHTVINPHHVIAPADGKVVVIERTREEEYFKDERIQISIFMSPFNVHVNRHSVSGIVKYFQYHPGKFLVAWHPKSSTENERTTMVVENTLGTPVLMRQIAGALAKRIKWYVKNGDRAIQGNEYGFIKFGSRVDIFLPLDAEVKVKMNDTPIGGETIIAVLK